jgi:hypothetical protein
MNYAAARAMLTHAISRFYSPAGAHRLFAVIRGDHDQGIGRPLQSRAHLIATHNLDLARRLDRIVALEDGRLKPMA